MHPFEDHCWPASGLADLLFDRHLLSHKINLFDLHRKYADVMTTAEIVEHLDA